MGCSNSRSSPGENGGQLPPKSQKFRRNQKFSGNDKKILMLDQNKLFCAQQINYFCRTNSQLQKKINTIERLEKVSTLTTEDVEIDIYKDSKTKVAL